MAREARRSSRSMMMLGSGEELPSSRFYTTHAVTHLRFRWSFEWMLIFGGWRQIIGGNDCGAMTETF